MRAPHRKKLFLFCVFLVPSLQVACPSGGVFLSRQPPRREAFAAAQLAQAVELAQRHPHLEAPLAEMVAHFGAMADEGGNRDLKDAC